MPNHHNCDLIAELDIRQVLAELEVPFPPDRVQWRVINTSNDKTRGHMVPYADARAYIDRLNALFSPSGWTRHYRIETLNNITRLRKGEAIVTGKVLVACTLTIVGLGSHSGTGEEWADDDNGVTSADAQAFKRACSCFGLGRYFYDFIPPWVDVDRNRQPRKTPALPAWAIPENWRKGMRPGGENGSGKPPASYDLPANGGNAMGKPAAYPSSSRDGTNHGVDATSGNELDARILEMERAVGSLFYRNILREYGRANQPRLIPDPGVKQKVLDVLESAMRGFKRLDEITRQVDANTVATLLRKLQAPALDQIPDMKTLKQVVLGLTQLLGPHEGRSA